MMALAVTYVYLFYLLLSDRLQDGGLDGYCQGLVPRVPWAIGYGPKFWIRPIPSSSK
jgi:hypothetical protein